MSNAALTPLNDQAPGLESGSVRAGLVCVHSSSVNLYFCVLYGKWCHKSSLIPFLVSFFGVDLTLTTGSFGSVVRSSRGRLSCSAHNVMMALPVVSSGEGRGWSLLTVLLTWTSMTKHVRRPLMRMMSDVVSRVRRRLGIPSTSRQLCPKRPQHSSVMTIISFLLSSSHHQP